MYIEFMRDSIKRLSFENLFLLVKDCEARIGSNHTDQQYISKQLKIIDLVQDELNRRNAEG